MYENLNQMMAKLPPEYSENLLPVIHEEFSESGKTIIVLDDDPTGTQTSYDVTVLTTWDVSLMADELKKKPAVLFILTNSRSLTEQKAVDLALEIGANLKQAVAIAQREIVVISRSDSTLRGHFPAEVDAIAQSMDMIEAVVVLVPAFIEGGRITVDDVHYLIENQELVPVSETPFARDLVFGYKNANLKAWVDEKTKGRVRASEVQSISIDDIRVGGPKAVCDTLKAMKDGAVCIVNAVSYRDLEVVVMGLLAAEKGGKKFLYRSSATLVPLRIGVESGKPYIPEPEKEPSSTGALVIVGSYVPKTTSQLTWLLQSGKYLSIEIQVGMLLNSVDANSLAETISKQTDEWLAAGKDVVIYTSRHLEVGRDEASNLAINAQVSEFLVTIVKNLKIRPRFMVAKGGITSSDLASKGLSAERAHVLGPILAGVPVWRMDEKSKFPGIRYVVFPGNVGSETALEEVCRALG
ncbi:four-carbon acid sugar kinase family protein [Spirosoma aerophilum]